MEENINDEDFYMSIIFRKKYPDRPQAPTVLDATDVTDTSFFANWSSVSSATSYRLDVSEYADFRSFVGSYNNYTVNGTSQAVTGLTAGTNYYYRVRAVNAAGASANSNTISLTTYTAEAQAYFSRVGIAKVANPVLAAALIDNIVAMGAYGNCLLYADIATGMETKVAGADTFITKIYDMSAKANDVLNTTETQQPRLVATGGMFDGSNDMLSCAGSNVAFPVTKKLTLFSWVNFTSPGLTYPRILNCEGKWSIIGDGTTGNIRWFGAGLDSTFGTVDHRNANVFVAITYNGDVGSDNINLYVNGGLTSAGSLTITGGGNLTAVGTTPVTIGNRAAGDRPLAGTANHCGIFNVVLSPTQLKSIFDLTKFTYGVA